MYRCSVIVLDSACPEGVLERAQLKALPVLNRAADVAPATQVCCGICRTCAATNFLSLLGAAGVWLLSRMRGVGRRA